MISEYIAAARATASIIGTRVRIIIPSTLARGEIFSARFSVTGLDGLPLDSVKQTLHFEDCVGIEGLPSSFAFPSGKSTGTIEGLQASGPGVALIRARMDTPAMQAFVTSNPAWVFDDPASRIYFGDLHVHTEYSNCSAWRCLSPEWCYEYARDISLLDFVAPADHLRGIASDPKRWPRLQALARQYNVPDRFVTFLAFESSHAQGFGGDNNVYFVDDDAPYFWLDREDMKGIAPAVHLQKLWSQLDANAKEYFTIPHHTGRSAKYRSWDEKYHDPLHEPLFEIFSSWGSSETRHSRLPISGGNNDAASYFVDALKAGACFGVIASSDDHATLPGSVHHFRTDPFCDPSLNGHAHKGLAAIRATALTRGALFDAMRQRHTFATTHARSLIEMQIGDASMGDRIPLDHSLRSRRDVHVRFTLDGSTTARITLMRNGEPFDTRVVNGPEVMNSVNEAIFRDEESFESVALRDRLFRKEPFLVYYARIEDRNGAHQWTSPIWIDA